MVNLSIIIVNWKSAVYLDNCIRTICENTEGLNYEIIVVDNASYDGSEAIANRYGEIVHFVQSNENLGFPRANNLGYRHSSGKVLLFLNPDTEILGGALVRMYELLIILSEAGCLGCRILNSDGTVQTSCIQAFPTITNQFLGAELLMRFAKRSRLWGMAPLFDLSLGPVEVEATSGACLMIRKEVFEKVGAFSEDYFMYTEDLDLCFKTHKAGFRNYYFGDVSVVHHGGGSTKERGGNAFSVVLMCESMRRFMGKFYGNNYSLGYVAAIQVAAVLRILILILGYPLVFFRMIDQEGFRVSLRKWWSIFRWSIGMDQATLAK